jgi:nucleotide-binding universal stress UspA family protein
MGEMPGIHRILVPLVFAEPFGHLLQQAGWLARRFQAEVILLHVVTPLSYPAGWLESGDEITARDLHARIIERAQEDLDRVRGPALDGIAVTRLLLRGEPAPEIVQAARERNAGLIVMATRGVGGFYPLLLGSVTAKVLHESDIPVWTGAHIDEVVPEEGEKAPTRDFAVRRMLCSVDLRPHSRNTLARAAEMAAAMDAALTLVHITSGVESFGPGGTYVNAGWKKTLVGIAAEEIAKLQKDAGTKAEVIVESGNVPKLLNQAAKQTNADVLVIGHIPGRSHWGDNSNGYGIIQTSLIPVLSV